MRALIRSPTVSVPVDLYVVAFSPALTVIVPPGRIPTLDSAVPVVNRAVPIAVAGAPDELEALEEPEELELVDVEDPLDPLDDDDVELPEGFSTCCTSDEISLLTRFKAVWLAMLAMPFAKFVSAWPMTLMSASSAEDAWLSACAWLQ